MESAEFTFLNTTGASGLSKPILKQMRAHVTKTNFAKRRQRIGSTPTSQSRRKLNRKSNTDLAIPRAPSPYGDKNSLLRLQQFVYLEGRHAPETPSEAAWFDLIASDPALVEASMAVAVQQWSPDISWQCRAHDHIDKAVSLIKERITSTTSRTDGILGAIITMALGAALANDKFAWNIHINGLTHIIRDRESRLPNSLPAWFVDFVVRDSINSIFDFPRTWHPTVLNALSGYRDRRVSKLAALCDDVAHLRAVIDSHHEHAFDTELVAREIEVPLDRLHHEARALRTSNDLHLDAAARAAELVLHLLWPSRSGAYLTLLAGELRDVMDRFPIKGCPYMHMTCFQFMIGAISADKGSPARTWFMERLSSAVRWMQVRGWPEPLKLLQERFLSDNGLNGRFRELWRELSNPEVVPEIQSSVSGP
ncbi:hypothetical protein BJY01DRAFT_107174 [Aspergillus pseudoustus]|uniref:Fungal-specific transcription factor domain-containing protein n=1 Tax=Aspergillus pseudoustus TaxID=1810923 RepID=A0ABR4KHZ8_9EURO